MDLKYLSGRMRKVGEDFGKYANILLLYINKCYNNSYTINY